MYPDGRHAAEEVRDRSQRCGTVKSGSNISRCPQCVQRYTLTSQFYSPISASWPNKNLEAPELPCVITGMRPSQAAGEPHRTQFTPVSSAIAWNCTRLAVAVAAGVGSVGGDVGAPDQGVQDHCRRGCPNHPDA